MEPDKLNKTRAKKNAYALLRQRPRSEAEMRNRLKLHGYGEELIDDCVKDLKRTGNIDDAKFAKLWMESRMHASPVGDVVLKHELKRKGVSDAIIEAVLSQKAKDYDEYEVAFSMAVDRFERLKRLDRRKAMKRLYDFLMRRGFAYETVRRVVENITGAAPT